MRLSHRADEECPAILEIGDHRHADDADDQLHPPKATGYALARRTGCGCRHYDVPPDARFFHLAIERVSAAGRAILVYYIPRCKTDFADCDNWRTGTAVKRKWPRNRGHENWYLDVSECLRLRRRGAEYLHSGSSSRHRPAGADRRSRTGG